MNHHHVCQVVPAGWEVQRAAGPVWVLAPWPRRAPDPHLPSAAPEPKALGPYMNHRRQVQPGRPKSQGAAASGPGLHCLKATSVGVDEMVKATNYSSHDAHLLYVFQTVLDFTDCPTSIRQPFPAGGSEGGLRAEGQDGCQGYGAHYRGLNYLHASCLCFDCAKAALEESQRSRGNVGKG